MMQNTMQSKSSSRQKYAVFFNGQVSDLISVKKTKKKHAFQSLKIKLNAERPTNKQQWKVSAVNDWQSIWREGRAFGEIRGFWTSGSD